MIDHLAVVGMVMGGLLVIGSLIGKAPHVDWMLLGAVVFGLSFWARAAF